ncbi:MAG: ribosomal protein S5, nonfunctional [Candidatus Uhrbacteria bacterium GW2011_GWF2_41_16]|uniref:Small ribosomal subunit protein uS5 n=2 Tax=Candidatus Uhriibacteriota TaxID=1752732 RepID=A0A0G0XNY9_9BACT|nr:MAG: ribosomal protein S5, nonfunctional [Candidatus Uhrbacteria bacterium GW2011_GWA2_41_10]KKR87535.1 MAG: ribosomal protein S5, nonfunctional [Candidatus Uhrbacteria bacterium GW2011_GWC2_41_11]KKR98515.1 MAG: ribosomal protein S5, nonfunctional [Candidatus Uhrbacteria bacterium GW2011_GWF2_41_16]HBO99949.1 30S ribosomal protein S5 [Candidatus Uhrbacteria bacterium]
MTETNTTSKTTEGKRPGRGRGPSTGGRSEGGRQGGRRGGRDRRPEDGEGKEYDQKILDLARVTRVTAGGKRMRFRAAVVIGDRKGTVGLGLAKGADVAIAVDKATRQAKKNIFQIPLFDQTIPHAIREKYGSAIVLLKPAPKGTGLKSGGAVRVLLELGGVPNAVSKIFGSTNKITVAKATMEALRKLQSAGRHQKEKK